MARSPEAYDLAHIGRALDRIEANAEATRVTMIAALGKLTDAIDTQTEMLVEILNATGAEPEPSPLGVYLEAMVASVERNTEVVDALADIIASWPEEMKTLIESRSSRY